MIRKLTEHAVLKNIEPGNVPYLAFPVLDQFDFIHHGFSTRLGGVSSGIYESMNLGFGRGDSEENVRENYRRFCSSVGVHDEDLVFTDQVHKAVVRVATSADKGMGIIKERSYQGVDGHITNEPGVPLLVFSADCVPILFVDPVHKAIGATHSGWRSTVLKIGAETVRMMQETYGTNPKDLVAVIGPCIDKDCYEVSEDVAIEFQKAFTKEQCSAILTKNPKQSEDAEQKYQLDLWEANRLILIEAGMKEENVTVSGVCTMCNSDLLFSHRATKGQRGSMAGVIEIKAE